MNLLTEMGKLLGPNFSYKLKITGKNVITRKRKHDLKWFLAFMTPDVTPGSERQSNTMCTYCVMAAGWIHCEVKRIAVEMFARVRLVAGS